MQQSIPLFCNNVTCFTKFSKLAKSLVSLSKHKATHAVPEFPFQTAAVMFVIGKYNPKYSAAVMFWRLEDALKAVGKR